MFKGKEKEAPKQNVVLDIDSIVEQSQWVKFKGVTHEVKPIEVQEFLLLANGLAAVERLKSSAKVDTDSLVEAMFDLLYPVMPTITKDMIRSSSLAQIAALMSFVLDHINGKMTDEKKKTLTPFKVTNPLSH